MFCSVPVIEVNNIGRYFTLHVSLLCRCTGIYLRVNLHFYMAFGYCRLHSQVAICTYVLPVVQC